MKISVLGAGSWGSALASAFSHIAPVCLFSRSPKQVADINDTKTNSGYLPDNVKFANNVVATNNLVDTCKSDLLVVATPINALRDILLQINELFKHNPDLTMPDVIWVCKGLENGSGLLPHQIIEEVFCGGRVNCGALLGPSFAFDVANQLPTAITLATTNTEFAFKWVELFKPIPNFRVYVNLDIIGAEVGSAVKNIVAIATGIIDGLQLGHNARAALITRSLHELSKLIVALGGDSKTVYGLTGVGDLILTCTGSLSRNRMVGLKLAEGLQLDEILRFLGHVAEGVLTTKEVYKIGKALGVEMPIVETVYDILYNKHEIKSTVVKLLAREPKME